MILQELEHEHRILDKQIKKYEKLNLVEYEMKIKELKKKKLNLKDKIYYCTKQFKKWMKEGSDPAPNYLSGKPRDRK